MGGRGGSGPRAAAAEPAATPAPAAPAAPATPLDNPVLAGQIVEAIQAMMKLMGQEWVSVPALRNRISHDFGTSRQDFDAAMRQLSRRKDINLSVDANRKAMTSEQVQNGVYLGGTFQTLVGLR